MSDAEAIAALKKAARAAGLAARAGLALDRAGAAEAAADRLEQALERVGRVVDARVVVAGYRPIRGEIDPTPAMLLLAARGARLAVPVIQGPGRPLEFRQWRPGAPMIRGPFGAEIPESGATLTPDLVIAPLAAFDRRGRRIGYGGGYYDRSLAGLRASGAVFAIGLAFAAQELAEIPTEPTDQRLDAVATEREAIFFPR